MRYISMLVLFLSGFAVAADGTVHEYVLDNGLKLIVKEDHRAPVVVSQVWYKVGASYEYGGVTGISHVLEHMMFKGTAEHPPGEFSRIIAENGGEENAFTSQDYTAYYQNLEKSRLPVSFELESDRMRNLKLQQEEFAKELQVVIEERRLRTQDKPTALTFENFNAVAFLNSSYRNPVIGWMDDLENLRLADLEGWYGTWYAPNNAIVVVAGDVDPEAVYALARKYFGPLDAGSKPRVKPRREEPQLGQRRVTVRAPAELPYLLMGYKVPVLLTAEEQWEPYALEVLAGILDGGESARLTTELVRGAQVAASAGAGYGLYERKGSMLLLSGTPAPNHDTEDLKQAFLEQVKRLAETPVEPEELERIKAQVIAGDVYERDSLFYQATQIGKLESVGLDWSVMDEYVARVQAVTARQVQRVAARYLIEDHLTVAVLDPLPLDPRKQRRAPDGGNDDVR
jgi:zinc protease